MKEVGSVSPAWVLEKLNPTFVLLDVGKVISRENWPQNLIYKPGFKEGEIFYGQEWNDGTLGFVYSSLLDRMKSLVSRALRRGRPHMDVEHGDIYIIYLDGKPDGSEVPLWMDTHLRTEVYVSPEIEECFK